MTAWPQSAGEPDIPSSGGLGQTVRASGRLNASSPTANPAGANIKGKWIGLDSSISQQFTEFNLFSLE